MSNPNSTHEGITRHAKLRYPKPDVATSHPLRNDKMHNELLEYLQQRLNVGKVARDGELPRLVSIDKKVAAWIRLKEEDRKRKEKQEEDGTPVLTDINLPLTFVHLDDMLTYYAQTFAPNRGMFYHVGAPEDQEESNQVVTKMNNDALYGGYYREVLAGIFSLLKYNCGGFRVTWSKDTGPAFEIGESSRSFKEEIRWQGNRLKALDRYNLLVDPSVTPTELHVNGEFAATVELRSRFWLQQRASKGVYYNCERALSSEGNHMNATYYRSPPEESKINETTESGATNWVSVLSGRPNYLTSGHEVVTIYIRLNPTEFGLVERDQISSRSRLEIWRFTIVDDSYIVEATYMNNVHDHLPFFMGLIHDDEMGPSQKSPGELISPLQDFASALMNIHTNASRSSLWGLTVYDPTMVDLSQIQPGEVAARVPVKPAAFGRDLRQAITEFKSDLDTKQTMQDVDSVMNIINQFFPTQSMPSQIASIDRAITDQVAALQQGVNRRQQKTARLIDDSVFRNVRNAMYYNVIQYSPANETIVDYFSGKKVNIDLTKLKETNLPFIIGQGLKAIDRQATMTLMQQLIFALIQAPQAAQGIDLLALMDHWTSMMDIETNLRQFRLQPQTPEGSVPGSESPEGAGVVDATGAPIQPATNPQRLTKPIYGANG